MKPCELTRDATFTGIYRSSSFALSYYPYVCEDILKCGFRKHDFTHANYSQTDSETLRLGQQVRPNEIGR